MTRVSCRQRRCSNWERGGCLAGQITINHLGACLTQDQGELLASAAEDDREIVETLAELAEAEWESDNWVDEDLDDEDDDEDDRDEPVSPGHRSRK